MDFLDFLPDDAEITKLIIVGPYPSYEYISSLIGVKGITKENTFLVVDDGWDVDKLKEFFPQKHVRRVRTSFEGGLVHAKMYYCCYKVKGKPKISFMIGSANASNNGMKYNAESLAFYRLSQFIEEDQNAIKEYFNNLKNGKSAGKQDFSYGTKGSKLYLPKILPSSKDLDSFSAWLRSGFLLYEYGRDSNFGVISFKLKTQLPETVRWGNSKLKTESEGGTNIRFPYIEPKFIKKGEDFTIKQYAIQTCMGFWISKDAYNFYQSNNSKVLEKDLIEYVQEKQKSDLAKEISDRVNYVKDLNNARADIDDKTKRQITNCLKEINKNRIKSAVSSKLDTDTMKAENQAFVDRYKSGFEKNRVPRLEDREWNRFVESWFESCMMQGSSKRCKSKLAKKIFTLVTKNLKNHIDSYDPIEIKNWFLEKDWGRIIDKKNKRSLRMRIKNYYKE